MKWPNILFNVVIFYNDLTISNVSVYFLLLFYNVCNVSILFVIVMCINVMQCNDIDEIQWEKYY